MSELKNRSEIVFLYDVTDANPNGDPLDENKPRIDEETGRNIVTDVRLKRTVRDYFKNYGEKLSEKYLPSDYGCEVFIQEEKVYEKGIELVKARGTKLEEELCELLEQASGFEEDEIKAIKEKIHMLLGMKGEKLEKGFKELLKEERDEEAKNELFEKFNDMRTVKIKEKVMKKFIDLRLFGATLAVANVNVQETGPVQFNFGRSLHKVDYEFYKGSLTMPVEPGKGYEKGKVRAEFSEEYRLPYSLISFHGIVNENAARNTGLTEEDMALLMDGIWNGTKNLITRSKIGQMPRLLLRIIYERGNYHIGDLDKKLEAKPVEGKREQEIRKISEVKLDVSDLINALEEKKEKIAKIEFIVDKSVELLLPSGQTITGKKLGSCLENIAQTQEMEF